MLIRRLNLLAATINFCIQQTMQILPILVAVASGSGVPSLPGCASPCWRAQTLLPRTSPKALIRRRLFPQQSQNELCADHSERTLEWFALSTAGVESLLFAGPISAGWGTAFDHPKEYNTSWEGFGQRYGMRLTGVSTGNAIEASLGAVWGEDPRYFRAPDEPFKKRVVNMIDLTFRAYRPRRRAALCLCPNGRQCRQ